jgi:hypothetical protein
MTFDPSSLVLGNFGATIKPFSSDNGNEQPPTTMGDLVSVGTKVDLPRGTTKWLD